MLASHELILVKDRPEGKLAHFFITVGRDANSGH
jgi:hypothetical protein